jgi:coatomer subunit beta
MQNVVPDRRFVQRQAMLIMTSIVRVGQSKFAAIPIDEDSQERIMNCVETLAKLQASKSVKEIFLHDTKAAYAKMVATQEVRRARDPLPHVFPLNLLCRPTEEGS